jgi:hypothetical protein
MISYWHWLFKGSGGAPGLLRYTDRWTLFHFGVGSILACIVPVSLAEAAQNLLLPVAGVFIGLSFAWGGNAQALLETPEVRKMAEQHAGGFEEYIYTFQSAVLFLLITLVVWVFAGLRVFDESWPRPINKGTYFAAKCFLYFLASLSVRECWHVVLGAQWFLLSRYKISKTIQKENKGHSSILRRENGNKRRR